MAKKKSKRTPAIVGRWEAYFGDGSLEDWQRLCSDLGLPLGDLGSITKCRKAISRVHVNIHDFLDAVDSGVPVKRFRNKHELAQYTRENDKIYPKYHAKAMGPVAALLRPIL